MLWFQEKFLEEKNRRLGFAGKENYIWRHIDRIQFVGKTVYLQTVEVIDLIENKDDKMIQLVDFFQTGLKYFYNRDWEKAIKEFERSVELESNPMINPSKIFIERAKKYKTSEPDDNWEGITILSQK